MRIKLWAETFETADSRRFKSLNWVSMPVGFHSSGYHSMLDEFGDDAAGVYGAWCALVSLAAQCPERGKLTSQNGDEYTIARIARETFLAKRWFELLIPWALKEGWLVTECDSPSRQPVAAQSSPSHQPVATQPSNGSDCESTRLPNQTKPNQRGSHVRASVPL